MSFFSKLSSVFGLKEKTKPIKKPEESNPYDMFKCGAIYPYYGSSSQQTQFNGIHSQQLGIQQHQTALNNQKAMLQTQIQHMQNLMNQSIYGHMDVEKFQKKVLNQEFQADLKKILDE